MLKVANAMLLCRRSLKSCSLPEEKVVCLFEALGCLWFLLTALNGLRNRVPLLHAWLLKL